MTASFVCFGSWFDTFFGDCMSDLALYIGRMGSLLILQYCSFVESPSSLPVRPDPQKSLSVGEGGGEKERGRYSTVVSCSDAKRKTVAVGVDVYCKVPYCTGKDGTAAAKGTLFYTVGLQTVIYSTFGTAALNDLGR